MIRQLESVMNPTNAALVVVGVCVVFLAGAACIARADTPSLTSGEKVRLVFGLVSSAVLVLVLVGIAWLAR